MSSILKPTIRKLVYFVIAYHICWLMLLQNPTIRELRARSNVDNLVVYNALGRQHDLALVEHSRRNVFKPGEWDCVAFMFGKGERIPDDDKHLSILRDELNCSISRSSHMTWDWGTFLQYISPTFVSNYDYVALVLDDMFIPDRGERKVDPTKLIGQMKKHNIDVMSPSIMGDSHGFRQVAIDGNVDGCLMEVDMIETFVQLFSREAWDCYYNMLQFTGGRGWCYDICFQSQCPHLRMAQDFSMRAMHMDKWVVELEYKLPEDEIIGTNLTHWKAKPKVAENEFLKTIDKNICEALGCDKTVKKSMKKLSCDSHFQRAESKPKSKKEASMNIEHTASKPKSKEEAPMTKPEDTSPDDTSPDDTPEGDYTPKFAKDIDETESTQLNDSKPALDSLLDKPEIQESEENVEENFDKDLEAEETEASIDLKEKNVESTK